MKSAILLCFFAAVSVAVSAPAPNRKVVSVTSPETVEVQQGNTTKVEVTFAVESGFHIQANPASEDYLIPSRLETEQTDGVSALNTIYPKGKPYRLKGTEEDLSVYDGKFEIGVDIKADEKAKPGEHSLKSKLRYQACDDHSCLPPTSVEFILPVRVMEP